MPTVIRIPITLGRRIGYQNTSTAASSVRLSVQTTTQQSLSRHHARRNLLLLLVPRLSRPRYVVRPQRQQTIPFLPLQMHPQLSQETQPAQGGLDQGVPTDSGQGNGGGQDV